jgi:hypothetical protein
MPIIQSMAGLRRTMGKFYVSNDGAFLFQETKARVNKKRFIFFV